MSSLLQFQGQIKDGKVRLEFTKVLERNQWGSPSKEVMAQMPCYICGEHHPVIYVIYRKPLGLWGHWTVFRWNNDEHVPDLSIPISVDNLPKDAQRLSDSETCECWHR